jgi:hypothetical protein
MIVNYKTIAMRCLPLQFESIKDLIPCSFKEVAQLETYPYISNLGNVISNGKRDYYIDLNVEVIEVFDGKYFLECCGLTVLEDVSEENIWNGSELQVKHIDSNKWKNCSCHVEYRLKPKEINPIQGDVDALLAKAKSLGIKLNVEFE